MREQTQLPSEYHTKATRCSIQIREMQRFVICLEGLLLFSKTFVIRFWKTLFWWHHTEGNWPVGQTSCTASPTKYTKGYWSQKGIFPRSWPTAMWAWAHSSLSSKEKTECSSGNTYLIHLANCSLILWEMIQVENRWGSMTPSVQGRLTGFEWVKTKWLNSHFAVEHIYWNPLVFGSSSDAFVTYDNCKAHKEQETLKPAHWFQRTISLTP